MTQRKESLKLFHKFQELFDRKRGICKIDTVDFRIKEDDKPICLQPYPVPKVHEEMFKNEVEHLVLL